VKLRLHTRRLGPIEVDAEAAPVPGLAVHLSVHGEPLGYRVTHIASGRTILPHWFGSKDEAKEFACLASIILSDALGTSALRVNSAPWSTPAPLARLTLGERAALMLRLFQAAMHFDVTDQDSTACVFDGIDHPTNHRPGESRAPIITSERP
jgi:hypothetical protein